MPRTFLLRRSLLWAAPSCDLASWGRSRSSGSTATPTRWICHRPWPPTRRSTLACSSPIARRGC
ncbi:hypothetical protein PF003_g7770 [Phytophthora fragariae]|nr:hypothetical protein PF003_g7770 [Phytophthora fragariae]